MQEPNETLEIQSEQRMLRTVVRGAYDIQKMRIMTGNRVAGNFKAKLGQVPQKGEDTLDAQGKQILKDLRERYNRITDGIVGDTSKISDGNKPARFPQMKTFKGDEVISSYTEFCLAAQYFELLAKEETHFRRLGNILEGFQIYRDFLKPIRGIGPAMGGVIISEINIHKARYPSSLWVYAGLDVVFKYDDDGEIIEAHGRSKKADDLIDIEYTDKEGNQKTKKGITYNPFLKTKLISVLATSFVRSGDNPYRTIYENYKHRLTHRPDLKEHSKGHINNMALRYMIKLFLSDLHRAWRSMEGYEPTTPYAVGKLGYRDHKDVPTLVSSPKLLDNWHKNKPEAKP